MSRARGACARNLAGLVGALALAACATKPAAEASARSVLLILVDDLGWRDLACTGSRYYETPAIDKLRASGVLFTQAYASAAVCSPTRAAFLTGRTPARIGITDWIHHASAHAQREAREGSIEGRHRDGFDAPPRGRGLRTPYNRTFLPSSEQTIAEMLGGCGFRTGYVGKWHLGSRGSSPLEHGFDFNAGGEAYGQPPSWFDPFGNKRFPEGIPSLPSKRKGQYLTAREADEALRFLEGCDASGRFLLVYAPYAVHSPIRAPRATRERFQKKRPPAGESQDFATYAAMIAELDRSIARILEHLEARGMLESTLVILTSDNGGATHFRATKNDPLRKGKGFPYEGGLRVPMILRLPGAARAGTSCDAPVISADVLPTVRDACAIMADMPAASTYGPKLDGVSLLRTLAGDAPPRALTWHFPHYWWGGRVTPWSVIRDGDTKLVHWYEDARSELYDLAADPRERHDLARERPQTLARMRAQLTRSLREQGAKLPLPAD